MGWTPLQKLTTSEADDTSNKPARVNDSATLAHIRRRRVDNFTKRPGETVSPKVPHVDASDTPEPQPQRTETRSRLLPFSANFVTCPQIASLPVEIQRMPVLQQIFPVVQKRSAVH